MPGIAESLIGQVQQAGQPRIAKSTTTMTGKEAPNIGMMGLLLAMLLEGEEKNIPPATDPSALGPTGGFMPTEMLGETPTSASGLNVADVLSQAPGSFGTPAPPSDIPGAPWETYAPASQMNIQELLKSLFGGGR